MLLVLLLYSMAVKGDRGDLLMLGLVVGVW